jgi:hypothetical protein
MALLVKPIFLPAIDEPFFTLVSIVLYLDGIGVFNRYLREPVRKRLDRNKVFSAPLARKIVCICVLSMVVSNLLRHSRSQCFICPISSSKTF